MAKLAIQVPDFTVTGNTFSSASTLGDTFANTGNEIVIIKTTTDASVVTITSPTQCNQGFSHDISISLGSGVEKVISNLPTSRFNDSSGLAKITCNPITGVSIAVIRA